MTTLQIASDQPSMPSRASVAPSASCIIVTPTRRATLRRNRAPVVPVLECDDSTTAVVSTRRQNGGSDWRSSHWSYRVCGATCLCAPATDAESIADAVVNLTNQPRPSSHFPLTFGLSAPLSQSYIHHHPSSDCGEGGFFFCSVPVRNGRTSDLYTY